EAKTLIQKALDLAPNDPFILDSLGWVEFQQGRKTEALAILEKAYGLRNDVDIAAHLGEVLWQLGDKTRARTIWQQALARDPQNDTLRATLKRLGVRP
ncbi:MAG: tetratricopeptide repeat protein, partial [Comamonas sp.]|nr:tetratricopeptide repeat protein [Comamonas sp.]